MLGTETVRALRAQGVRARICGCSANNMEDEFMEAGADCFVLKPFPCEKDELRRELLRVLSGYTAMSTNNDMMNGSAGERAPLEDHLNGNANTNTTTNNEMMNSSTGEQVEYDT